MGIAGLPTWAGEAPSKERLTQAVNPSLPWLPTNIAVYAGAFLSTPIIALLVQQNELAGATLTLLGVGGLGYLIFEMTRSDKVERERLQVVLVLMFFSMLFWAFFEQAGLSVNLFTDRNVDRVFAEQVVNPMMWVKKSL